MLSVLNYVHLLQVELNGKNIPAGTLVMPQIGAVHFDEALFPDAEQFRPERFLDEHGNYAPSKFLNQYGVGERECFGRNLARPELRITLASLIQNFTFDPIDPGNPSR